MDTASFPQITHLSRHSNGLEIDYLHRILHYICSSVISPGHMLTILSLASASRSIFDMAHVTYVWQARTSANSTGYIFPRTRPGIFHYLNNPEKSLVLSGSQCHEKGGTYFLGSESRFSARQQEYYLTDIAAIFSMYLYFDFIHIRYPESLVTKTSSMIACWKIRYRVAYAVSENAVSSSAAKLHEIPLGDELSRRLLLIILGRHLNKKKF